jgi:hypothetical protein
MSEALPGDIVFHETADGVRYRLPAPRLGFMRLAGLAPLLFGLVPIGMAVAMGGLIVTQVLKHGHPFGIAFCACGGLMLLPFLIFGLIFVFMGLWLLAGHNEIELTDTRLRAVMRVGWLRWSRRRPRDRVRQFTVVRDQRLTSRVTFLPPHAFTVLQAECLGSKPLRLAVGFAPAWLRALASDLGRRLQVETDEMAARPVPVVEESADPEDIRERPEQPLNSQAVLERHDDGVTLDVPPVGIWAGSNKFFVIWTFLWCGMLATVIVGLVLFAAAGQNLPQPPAYAVLFCIPFFLVGIGCLSRGLTASWT